MQEHNKSLQQGFADATGCRAVLPPRKTGHPRGSGSSRARKLEECLRAFSKKPQDHKEPRTKGNPKQIRILKQQEPPFLKLTDSAEALLQAMERLVMILNVLW